MKKYLFSMDGSLRLFLTPAQQAQIILALESDEAIELFKLSKRYQRPVHVYSDGSISLEIPQSKDVSHLRASFPLEKNRVQ